MYTKMWCVLIATILIASISGCSSGSNPGLPDSGDPPVTANADSNGGAVCLGLWQVVVDLTEGSITAVDLRGPEGALNVLGFMEPPVMKNLKIDFGTLSINTLAQKVVVDVILQHPLTTGEDLFSGFDVRGIVFGPDVLNADGFTRWFNPKEFSGLPFGYTDGLLGAPNSHANYPALFNGFKYFASGIGLQEGVAAFFSKPENAANRGVFLEGSNTTRRYELGWANTDPPLKFLIFNYAVYANYEFPKGFAPYKPEDFPISANSIEAICAAVTELENSLYYDIGAGSGGGNISLDIEVFDWQGVDAKYKVSIQSAKPGLIDETAATFKYLKGPCSAVFTVNAAGHPTSITDIELLITCSDGRTYGANYFFGLMSSTHPLYSVPVEIKFRHMLHVAEVKHGLLSLGSGNLPQPLPSTDIKDFCVIGSGNPKEGVYYFGHIDPLPPDTQGEAIYKYTLDYSGSGTLYYNIYNPFGYPDNALWGNETDLAFIDMASGGSGVFMSKSTAVSGMPPFLHRDWGFWFNQTPLLQNGCSSPANTAEILKWVDASADYRTSTSGNIYALAITDELKKGTYPPPVKTKVGFMTLRSPYTYPGSSLSYNYAMFEKDTVGNIDGKVDDINATRLAVDGAPQGVAQPSSSNTVVYILESDSTPDIEVFEINKLWVTDSSYTYPITTIHGFSNPPTTPVDIECFPAYTLGFSKKWNWVAVLENNGNGTWQVSLWEQKGAFVNRSSPINGKPLNLDIDGTRGHIHVWFMLDSTLKWAKYEYKP